MGSTSTSKYAGMTDAELVELADELAEQRTAIRLEQNAVADEQRARAALAGLPESTRELILSGNVGQSGGLE